MKIISLLFVLLFLSTTTYSQSILNDFDTGISDSVPTYNLITENIRKVSISKRIYLISNSQESFAQGDFITMLIEEKPIARGLVAKLKNGVAAIKITKIYSLPLYKTLRRNLSVQVIRGDDSFYRKEKPKDDLDTRIADEDDLFNESTILEEDIYDEQRNKNAAIKNDNIFSFSLGLVSGYDESFNEATNQQLNATYAYQLDTNIWIEGLFGRNIIKDFPAATIDTEVTNYTVRAKYAVKGPLFTIFMPYLGFQMVSATSPGAGDTDDQDQAQQEISLVDSLNEKGLVFGITALKRLVPGWFMKAEVGSDMISFGLALEF